MFLVTYTIVELLSRFEPRDAMQARYLPLSCVRPSVTSRVFYQSPVHTSNIVEATFQQATLLPVASTMLPFWATMSKQRSTLSKGRNFNAKLVRHCCRFWQQCRTLLRHCCWCGPGLRRLNRHGGSRPRRCAGGVICGVVNNTDGSRR